MALIRLLRALCSTSARPNASNTGGPPPRLSELAEQNPLVIHAVCHFAGLAGVMQYGRLTVGDPTTAISLELDVIAAVVIGGGSLSGGRGSITGALLGAFFMSVLANG